MIDRASAESDLGVVGCPECDRIVATRAPGDHACPRCGADITVDVAESRPASTSASRVTATGRILRAVA